MRVSTALLLAGSIYLSQAGGIQPPPTFRSSVELLTFETSVSDRDGRPLDDLTAADFSVRVDGQPRKVVSARLFASERRLTSGAAPTPQYFTNISAPSGRAVIFAIDRESIRSGTEKPLLETAAGMLDALSPADAAGLAAFPGGVEPTRDHARVADALLHMTGTQPATGWMHVMTWDEAVAFERKDSQTIARVVERECPQQMRKELPSPCPRELTMQAVEMLLMGRARARTFLGQLTGLIDRLASLRAPRDIVLISGGLPFDIELLHDYQELARRAAQARVVLYVVHVDQPTLNAESARPSASVFGGREMATGLGNIAASTGGRLVYGIGRATGALDRIVSDVTHSYELAVESQPSDGDGRAHKLDVSVSRAGAVIRASHTIVAAGMDRARPGDLLERALVQPTDVSDIPLAVSAYNMHSQQTGKVRLLVSAELAVPNAPRASTWGYVLLDGDTTVATVKHPAAALDEGSWTDTTSIDVPPGHYRLRFAGVDSDGRTGVVECAVDAGLREVNGMLLGDLLVGSVVQGRLEPASRVRGEGASALLEIAGVDPATATASLDLIRGGTSQSARRTPMSFRTREDGVIVAAVPLYTAGLIAGRYTAHVSVTDASGTTARVSRIVEITDPAPAAAPTAAPSAAVSSEETGVAPAPAVQPGPIVGNDLDAVMARVGQYVSHYGARASLLVGVETYRQQYSPVQLGEPPARTLTSEFALVRVPGNTAWAGYRDVIAVNGKPIPDRKNRLETLFRADTPDVALARRIADESARFNIGAVTRNFNVPTAALFFFQPADLKRFSFVKRGEEMVGGILAWEIEFKETAQPTLIRTSDGREVPSHGTIWVVPGDGTVVRTEMFASGFHDFSSTAQVDVRYARDARLGIWLPSSMEERYTTAVAERHGISRKPIGAVAMATATATYADFKRFETSATIK